MTEAKSIDKYKLQGKKSAWLLPYPLFLMTTQHYCLLSLPRLFLVSVIFLLEAPTELYFACGSSKSSALSSHPTVFPSHRGRTVALAVADVTALLAEVSFVDLSLLIDFASPVRALEF